ncbi:SNARE-interacting protein KEULE-like [Dioscorea cayenensis subsp. rotundata]|uniref:SNARE-interacting protein KEULE-like n=1 Tax=Dioscorea cayennensis subsp. rotundata TaxID=55577 RepID=A0AB40BAY1_DIOCR|nr:SNARE-interacting protein KEULE-like [Dioscorea cayenensis subsp. rotundata]
MIEELIQKLSKDELPKHEYACMNDPVPTIHGFSQSSSFWTGQPQSAHSMRSRRTAATWVSPWNSDDGYSNDSVLRHASSDLRKMGQ